MRLMTAFVLLAASTAWAQRVVILEIEGDRGGKLRSQVESALKKADTVEVVGLDKYKAAAGKKKLKGPAAMTPAGLSRVAKGLKIDAGVGGELGKKFEVQIWDSTGQQLWTKELKVKNGLLSSDFAGKLAKAITAAAKTAPKAEEEGEGGEGSEEAAAPPPKREEEKPAEEVTPPPPPPRREALSEEERERRRGEEAAEEAAAQRGAEPERDQDLEQEGRKIRRPIGPKGFSLWLAGTTTWRYYCARPGVSSCGEYDKLVEDKMPTPPGDIVDFKPQVPYAGFHVEAELFPISWVTHNALQGIGVVGAFALGFSLTRVTVQSPAGSSMPKEVVSTDRAWAAALAYRYYFSFDADAKSPAVGYAGLYVGAAGRIFEIDAKAMVPLPGTNRVYPVIGLEVAIPIIKYFGVEASGAFFIAPKPGPDEIAGYGDPMVNGGASATGFQLEGGIAGTIWGPVGYRLQVKYTPYTDHYFGRGNKWTYKYPDGTEYTGKFEGAAFESYVTFTWGITASF